MKGEIIPFPCTARKTHIEKVAAEVAGYSPRAAQKYLANLVNKYREKLERWGVELSLIEREVSALHRQYENRSAYYRAMRGAA